MAARCLNPPRLSSTEDDTMILFSTSNSPQDSISISPSSSSYHSSVSTTSGNHKLSVTNLSYTLHPHKSTPFSFCLMPQKPKPLHILNSVSFSAKSSEIVAVVGPSGTGKSTLLRVIAGRVKDKDFDPRSISINDHPMTSPAQLRKICGFVAQEDNLLPLLTVKETLMFSAKFRLKEMSSKDREVRVETLMQELGLLHVADSYVGDDENRGISGGERKRVSIGSDMIHNPPILVLDEPTSGLDSSSALQVIELLSLMVQSKRRIVILSIHQPSYRILQYISRFLILSHGSVVHNGSLRSLEKTITRLGFQIPMQLNALEFAMEIIQRLEDSKISTYDNDICPVQDKEEETGEVHNYTSDDNSKKICSAWYWSLIEILFLCSRFWKVIYRTKQLFLARTMQALVGGFGLGSVYIKVRKDEGGVAERLGLFAFSLSFLLSSTVEALPIFLQERCVLMKEASRGAYKISSYMVANTLVFFPFLFVVSILFSVPVYWIVGLNPSFSAFAFFIFIVWLIVLMVPSGCITHK
ncbi:ABC transporter G family member 23 isoform X2 [Prosopis cineraria]|uniref:ABC transporter G family member 23 isoform X2 n=1 Tax=Prosopis cineraria TaxID=364024 RepID=UPI00240ED38E|nr:ABC transporter G family member 23 isoform X2 [Prosopis cineraria]